MELHATVGHSYSHTTASGNARVHLGNVYNYADSDLQEKRVLDWLTPLDPSQSHNQACQQHQEGTLSFFFDDIRFQQWRDSPEGGVPLWCRGNAGAGKTTLLAQILQHLQVTGVPRGNLAVFYSRHAERNNQTAESVLGSILAQLLQHNDHGFSIPDDIKSSALSQSRLWSVKPTIDKLASWLNRRLQAGSPVFVLLDAVDELDYKSRRELFGALNSSHHNLKLLVTSRNIPQIGAELGMKEALEIRAGKPDLQAFTLAKLSKEASESFVQLIWGPPGPDSRFETLLDHIVFKIVDSADDMFLLASLNLDRILECNHAREVHHYLDNIPSGVDELYDEAWERAIGDGSSHRAALAKEALMWTLLAERPFTVGALGELLSSLGFGNGVDRLTEQEIVSSCAGLVRTELPAAHTPSWRYRDDPEVAVAAESPYRIVTFSHPSAYRYLSARRKFLFPRSDDLIVERCLSISTSAEVLHALPITYSLMLCLPLIAFWLQRCIRLLVNMYISGLDVFVVWAAIVVGLILCGAMLAGIIMLTVYRLFSWAERLRFGSRSTVPSFDAYRSDCLISHAFRARPIWKARILARILCNYRFHAMLLGLWAPFITMMVMVWTTLDAMDNAARYVWSAGQIAYLAALLAALVCATRSSDPHSWIDVDITFFFSFLGWPVLLLSEGFAVTLEDGSVLQEFEGQDAPYMVPFIICLVTSIVAILSRFASVCYNRNDHWRS